jgi:hypothetical protein
MLKHPRNASKVQFVHRGTWIKHTSVYNWKCLEFKEYKPKTGVKLPLTYIVLRVFIEARIYRLLFPVLRSVILLVNTNILEVE